MTPPKNPRLLLGMQFVGIVVLTIAVFFIVDFGRRTTAGYYVSQAEKDLEAEIQVEFSLRKELEERRDYIRSDEHVEEWAREEAHMIRPGDQSMILITSEAPQKVLNVPQLPDSPATPSPVPHWHRWWRLFFDTEPGRFRAG